MRPIHLLVVLALVLVVVVVVLRWGGGGPGESRASVEDTLARDRVAGLVATGDNATARKVIAPLVARGDAAFPDLLVAAVIELKEGRYEPAAELVERAAQAAPEAGPEAAAVAYLRGRLAEPRSLDRAIDHYRRALDLAPDDLPTKLLLARCLEYGSDYEEAIALLEQVEAMGEALGGPWYVSAIYRLFMTYNQLEEEYPEKARRYADLFRALDQRGLRAAKDTELIEGELARVRPPEPGGNRAPGPVRVPTYREVGTILAELGESAGSGAGGGGGELAALDLDGNRVADLVSAGEGGLRLALRRDPADPADPGNPMDPGSWVVHTLSEEPARLVRPIDLHKDDSLDLFFVSGGQLRLMECEGEYGQERWVPSPLELPPLPSPPADLELVDFDHDGDLDLLLVGDFGGRLLRNDGAGKVEVGGELLPRGAFVDASAEAGLPDETDAGGEGGTGGPGSWRWCTVEDLDGDHDVDLVLGGPGKLFVGSSLRSGAFEDVSERVFGGADLAREPLLADFDGDARVDAFLPGAGGEPATLFLQGRDGRMTAHPTPYHLPPGARPLELDVDLDGTADVLWPAARGAAQGVLALGLDQETAGSLGEYTAGGPLACVDLEPPYPDHLEWELLRLARDGVHVFRASSPVGNAMRIGFRGVKDNRQGIGAVVEVRARGIYRRHFWRGTTTLYGLGAEPFFDVVRVTWPNGVVGNDLDVEKGDQIPEKDSDFGIQTTGLVGSCPFLYAWNGETYGFVSDVLGITPLGLPMAPGQLVLPDHDEYVLVTGDQLVPRGDGRLVLQFTEELREVTYLDRIRLDVVDHPAGTEVQPTERFCFPPFPAPRTHVMGELRAPLRATGSDGKDWTAALSAVDDVHALCFEPLSDGQFLGLAEPHFLELEFDPAGLAEAGELRLVCSGWLFWTDASVNVAAARTPGLDFVPPVLWVPSEDGWRPAGPPVGFPAGKSKTMVLDVTDILSARDPRLRISSTLRLYWDSIRLGLGADDEQRTSALEPTAARVWPRGFSAPVESDREDLPERFRWDELATDPRWNQHPGLYTRFGEVLALLGAVDDRYVIMGSGDALTVEFDGRDLPPVPAGWVRDYLVYLDGWAKDRDPNTLEALNVEPLPFHAMSGYPYGPDETYPDTPAHRAWRERWNTRPAYQHIVPLSPVRQAEWAAD